ncbi:MAG: ABC transporter permease [Chitinophagaceae bacterium]|nr:ABC transporter permease [Chitinophagaceae bacterium]
MFKCYFLLAWRVMRKQRVYTLINILGLAIGICSCIVIYLVTGFEFSFDRFHPDKERIFRIVGEVQRLNGDREFANSVVPDVAGIETAIPGFEAKTGIWHYGSSVKAGGKTFEGEEVVVTTPDYFKIFSYQWLAGTRETALSEPNSVVITEKRAHLYFGDQALQKVLGASVMDITNMLSKDFGVLILLSAIVATPVAWFVMNRWLDDYAYRTNFSWWIFFAATFIALAIAMITVSYQAIGVAVTNPVKHLRTE